MPVTALVVVVMGRSDNARKARILAGLEMTTARKRDISDAVPCSECGAPIPRRVLRAGHQDLDWCGVLVVSARDNPAQVLKVICPVCAQILRQKVLTGR